MNIKVMYHTLTGNTRKVAEAIAAEVGVEAQMIGKDQSPPPEPIDLLFIGDGIYAGKPGKDTISYIDKLTPETVKSAVIFATYGGQDVIGDRIAKLLQDKGLNVVGDPFSCKGKCWFFVNRKRPNDEDLETARQFARSIVSTVEKQGDNS